MARHLIEEVGTGITRLEFQQSQHWTAKESKMYCQWTLLVEQDPPLDTDAISMQFDCAVPCVGRCNTIVNLNTVT